MVAFAFGIAAFFAQTVCSTEAQAFVDRARERAAEFDLAGAADQLRTAVDRGCAEAEIGALYLSGLVDAREAFRYGGSPESLTGVRQAIASLAMLAQGRAGPAEIARLMLHAAAAAAQSERDEMRLYIEAASRMELLQRAAGQSGAPVVSALETAGDVWLRVHRYEDARRSYAEAEEQIGPTLRVMAGLARAAARLNDTQAACAAFQRLLDHWGSRQALPDEIAEARAYLERTTCSPLPH